VLDLVHLGKAGFHGFLERGHRGIRNGPPHLRRASELVACAGSTGGQRQFTRDTEQPLGIARPEFLPQQGNPGSLIHLPRPAQRLAIAADDIYSIAVDGDLVVDAASGLLANDMDVDGDALGSAAVTVNPANGSVSLNADGSFVYTPIAGFRGADSFTYTISDGTAISNEATVTIFVNDAPVAAGDSYQTDEDTPLVIDAAEGVLANDSDEDGDSLTAVILSDPFYGTLTLNSDGSFTYTPNSDFHGTDTFAYTANDGLANSVAATVTITVQPVNDAPMAADDTYHIEVDGELIVDAASGLLANDTDADGSPVTARTSLVITEINYAPYSPTADELAIDSQLTSDDFEFIELQNVGNQTISLSGVVFNEGIGFDFADSSATELAPGETVVVARNREAFAIRYGTGVSIAGEFVDSLSDSGETLAFMDADGVTIQRFTYGADDGWPVDAAGGGKTLEVADVSGDYHHPANWAASSAAGGSPGSSSVAAGPVDYLMAALVESPLHGVLNFHDDGSFEYEPEAGYIGTDQFVYKANDGGQDSNAATVTIKVGESEA